jgi:hypothetical protein
MNYARIINDVAIDVSTNPTLNFTPDIAAQFVAVADDVKPGWKKITEIIDGNLTANTVFKNPYTSIETYDEMVDGSPVVKHRYVDSTPVPVVTVKPPKITVIEWKMLFTSQERIAVKASVDPVIIDLQELMNDPRTVNVDLSLQSIQDALDYMTYLGLIAVGRKAEILTGVVK